MTDSAEVATSLKLSTVILHTGSVEALERCRGWYLKLGLPLASETPTESYWFDCGPTLLGVHTSDDVEVQGTATVYFDVADADEAYERLLGEGFEFSEPPSTKSWGGRVCYLKDPVGNTVGLVAAVKS
jgi:predicted enzyme related to lactoylglutathione lyase